MPLDSRHRGVATPRAALALLAFPAAGGMATVLTMVTSLTFASTDVTVGSTVKGKLTVDSAPPGGTVAVSLSSSNARVLSVPPSVSTTASTPLAATFSSHAGAVGCATVYARTGQSPSRGAMVAVHPAPQPASSWAQATMASHTVRGGNPATLILKATSQLVVNLYVGLATDNASIVTVPSSATVPTSGQEVKVELPTHKVNATSCAVITANFSGNTPVKVLLKVTP